MMMSPTTEVTMPPKAAPMMTPTARSTTFPFMANSRNSFSMQTLVFDLAHPTIHRRKAGSVDQARMPHGATPRDARGLGHRHHRQSQPLVDLAEQRQRVFHRRRIGLDEQIGVQRHQLVVQLQRGLEIAL